MNNYRQNLYAEKTGCNFQCIPDCRREISLKNGGMSTHLRFLYIFALFTSRFSIHLHKPYKIDEGYREGQERKTDLIVDCIGNRTDWFMYQDQ
jgi:hypothetical protein